MIFRMIHNRRIGLYDMLTFIMLIQFNIMIKIADNMPNKTYNRPRMRSKRCGSPRRRKVMCSAVMVYAATAKRQNITPFDTDTAMIGVDNRTSGLFSHVASDFVGDLRECHMTVKGFGGTSTSNVKMGTLKWSWIDDMGKMHTHYISDSYYSK